MKSLPWEALLICGGGGVAALGHRVAVLWGGAAAKLLGAASMLQMEGRVWAGMRMGVATAARASLTAGR